MRCRVYEGVGGVYIMKINECLFQYITILNINFRVLVMDKGVAAEFQSPKKLLEDHDSLFYNLYKSGIKDSKI